MKFPSRIRTAVAASIAMAFAPAALADAVTDWNAKASDLIAEAKMGTPPAVRVMALVQTSVAQAVSASRARTSAAAVDAAVASAARTVLARALPAQEAALNAAYQSAIAAIPDTPSRAAGIEAGEKAAQAVLASRADDGAGAPDVYRPATNAGNYVPTVVPAVPQWGQRKPWHMARGDQLRPAPPPAFSSATWTRDFEEVKTFGSKASAKRSAEQTEIARFWEFSLPSIYFGAVKSVADQPGRDIERNARLYAAVAQAMDDAMISVMDAKYHYKFWRPVTAIRNADQDHNDATERDAAWTSFIDNPMHPEYPSAHSILAGSVGTVLKADIGDVPAPVIATTSGSLKGVTRRWSRIEDFMNEVAVARIYEGIHFRNSTEVGLEMGRKVGALAAARYLSRAD